jgi:hypothetical protein
MPKRKWFLVILLAGSLCVFAGFGAAPAAQAADQGVVLAQWQQPGMQQGGQQQGGQQRGQQGGQQRGQQGGQTQGQQGLPQGQPGGAPANNSCVQSYQRCVMMCAGVVNCVNNCNIGYAVCQQQGGGS